MDAPGYLNILIKLLRKAIAQMEDINLFNIPY